MSDKGRGGYPSDVTDEEWAFVLPYLLLCREDSPQRKHELRTVPTARYRLDIGSLRNQFASDFVFALSYLVYRAKGDKISFVEHGDPVSYPAGPAHIVCHDDQCCPVFG